MSRYELLSCDWCNQDCSKPPIGEDQAHDEGWAEWYGTEDRPSALGDGKTWRASVTVDLCSQCKAEPEAVAHCEQRGLKVWP